MVPLAEQADALEGGVAAVSPVDGVVLIAPDGGGAAAAGRGAGAAVADQDGTADLRRDAAGLPDI